MPALVDIKAGSKLYIQIFNGTFAGLTDDFDVGTVLMIKKIQDIQSVSENLQGRTVV